MRACEGAQRGVSDCFVSYFYATKKVPHTIARQRAYSLSNRVKMYVTHRRWAIYPELDIVGGPTAHPLLAPPLIDPSFGIGAVANGKKGLCCVCALSQK